MPHPINKGSGDQIKESSMTIDRAVMCFAGCVVLLAVVLAQTVNPLWIWLAAVAGANLVQASFTRFCPAAVVFKKLGLRAGGHFA
jgi:Flp pilus assembly protein TadB